MLIAALALSIVSPTPPPAPVIAATCAQWEIANGLCVAPSNPGDHTEIEGWEPGPWFPDAPGAPSNPDWEYTADPGKPESELPRWGKDTHPCEEKSLPPSLADRLCPRGPDDDPAPQAPPPITRHDVARFAPAPPAVVAEPGNVAIVGAPMNAVAPAGPESVSGTLFEYPVTVHFVPESYTFSYGDGTVLTSPTGGITWADLGLAQFTPTDTSHAYNARGTYDLTVGISYSAIVDFGAWGAIPVQGLVTVTTTPIPIEVMSAHSVLTGTPCRTDVRLRGC